MVAPSLTRHPLKSEEEEEESELKRKGGSDSWVEKEPGGRGALGCKSDSLVRWTRSKDVTGMDLLAPLGHTLTLHPCIKSLTPFICAPGHNLYGNINRSVPVSLEIHNHRYVPLQINRLLAYLILT